MGVARTALAQNLGIQAMAQSHLFDPENPDLSQLQVALVQLSLAFNELVASVQEDEIAALALQPAGAQPRGPVEGIAE
jgi:hypothetical protein